MNSPKQIGFDYIRPFWAGGATTVCGLVVDNVSFAGPFVQIQGKDAFFTNAAGLITLVRGCRLLRQ